MQTVLDSLNAALRHAMSVDERVYLIGEDLLDPYGGAFKVTRGLSTAFPDRVLTTPVSEAGIVGLAAGMALRGLRPVVEIMFGDFSTLIADQLINHVAKFRWMYNDQVRVPIVIRTPMGGRRGYGPTHSQTLEKIYLGIPGLRVLAPCALGDPGDLLECAILADEDPVLFIESKLLYLVQLQDGSSLMDFDLTRELPGQPFQFSTLLDAAPYTPTYTLTLHAAPAAELTLVAYGYMAELARQACLQLAYEHELICELVVPTQLSPFEIAPLLNSAARTRRVLIIEEGTLTMGWGAELAARLVEALGPDLKRVRRLAGRDMPVPASARLENAMLPGLDDIIAIARAIAHPEVAAK